ncbi:hypothetical protein L914_08798 [Phytophthora nicotianae]|uniref:Uncharacterized protein n=1 Tax=Phytophthora nicotianae TaxID=4792 RepID=W2NF19_PHYNI|nr:hypothetical protein L914_08798 [Phytophthora nicotianae]
MTLRPLVEATTPICPHGGWRARFFFPTSKRGTANVALICFASFAQCWSPQFKVSAVSLGASATAQHRILLVFAHSLITLKKDENLQKCLCRSLLVKLTVNAHQAMLCNQTPSSSMHTCMLQAMY